MPAIRQLLAKAPGRRDCRTPHAAAGNHGCNCKADWQSIAVPVCAKSAHRRWRPCKKSGARRFGKGGLRHLFQGASFGWAGIGQRPRSAGCGSGRGNFWPSNCWVLAVGSLRVLQNGGRRGFMTDWIGQVWCKRMHRGAMWPIHGKYVCPRCLREYPVAWEGDRLEGSAAQIAQPVTGLAARVALASSNPLVGTVHVVDSCQSPVLR